MYHTRADLEAREATLLARYGMASRDSRGRRYPEPEPEDRTAYQRDRDRIIHTAAFRRLDYKTQVFVYHEGDHYRNRLTHSIEVAQIGRSMARALGANEDLTEAICLAHDLGHPAFGHTGEQTLNKLMAEHGGFDHQRQTMRIVTLLEDRYVDFPGLNLTYEVREGLVKHDTDYDVTDATGYEPERAGTLECQIANLADEIAYNAADLDDGLRSGVLDPAEVQTLEVWAIVMQSLAEPETRRLTDQLRARVVRRLLGLLVNDALATTAHRLAQTGVASVADVRGLGRNIVGYSDEMTPRIRALKAFLLQRFYLHPRVMRMSYKANHMLTALFNAYGDEPRQLPTEVQARIQQGADALPRVICDYIAGMTDRYAILEHKRLFDPEARV